MSSNTFASTKTTSSDPCARHSPAICSAEAVDARPDWNPPGAHHLFDKPDVQRWLYRDLGMTVIRSKIEPKAYDNDRDDGTPNTDFLDASVVRQLRIPEARMAFTHAVLGTVQACAAACMGAAGQPRRRTVLVVKQIKGAGAHTHGSKSHHLYPQFTLAHPDIDAALRRRAVSERGWEVVRRNLSAAGGGPAARVTIATKTLPLVELGELPLTDLKIGEPHVPTTAVGAIVNAVAARDPTFIVTNADGNEASGLRAVNDAMKIRHPVADELYSQAPDGRVYEPISEDACAGLAAATALAGARAAWFSYESFAVNGLGIFQTVTQAMAEVPREVPSAVAVLTAGALEQGRNGWTHQRPEVESYLAAMMRNGNVYPLYPPDANAMQAAFAWAMGQRNNGVVIIASKTAVPVRLTLAAASEAVRGGFAVVHQSRGEWAGAKRAVLATVGDLVLGPAVEAAKVLETESWTVRVVAVVNPRRLYRPQDVAWAEATGADGQFVDDATFDRTLDGDVLLGVSGGASATLEPVLLRSRAARRDVVAWRRGETTASPAELMELNGITAGRLADGVRRLSKG